MLGDRDEPEVLIRLQKVIVVFIYLFFFIVMGNDRLSFQLGLGVYGLLGFFNNHFLLLFVS